jgi:hypothetical protein
MYVCVWCFAGTDLEAAPLQRNDKIRSMPRPERLHRRPPPRIHAHLPLLDPANLQRPHTRPREESASRRHQTPGHDSGKSSLTSFSQKYNNREF